MALNTPQRKQRRAPKRVTSDDGLVMAIEIVVTPLIFAAAGFGIDTWLGTRPIFTAILGIVAFAGKVVGEWYRYSSRMDKHEAEMTANRPTQPRALRQPASADGTGNGINGTDDTTEQGLPTGVKL